jgi:hypothetical protein
MRRKEAHEFTKYIFDNKKTKFSIPIDEIFTNFVNLN